MPKPNSSKLVVLLCLLISLTIFSMLTSTTNADDLPYQGGGAVFYGSTYNMTEDEQNATLTVIAHMEYFFEQQSYPYCNSYGNKTQRESVLGNASAMEDDYHRVAVFHHGHGGFVIVDDIKHYDYFDDDWWENETDQIRDYAVYDETGLGKHFFVVIWACRQGDLIGYMDANNKAVGMPHAWHHTPNLTSSGPYCFIGFKDASMPLTQESNRNASVIYRDFLTYFYYYALDQGFSVIEALDKASDDLYGIPYTDTELHTEFTAYWPGNMTGKGWMKIYGNNSTHLNQYDFMVRAKDLNGTYYANKDVYIDIMHNLANTNSTIKTNEGYHTVFVNDFWEPGNTGNRSFFKYYTYDSTKYYPNPATWPIDEDWTVTAVFELKQCPGDVNGDGVVDIDDITICQIAFGSFRGHPKWDSTADLNCDGIVDIDDVIMVALNFGKVYW